MAAVKRMSDLHPNEELLVLPDPPAAAQAAAETVVQILSHREGRQSVALAGGRTPAAMYQLLTQPPLSERIDWHTIDWFWGDERCVPPDHPDSNHRMARETLLAPLGIAAERIHRMPADAADLDAAAWEYEEVIRNLVPENPQHVPELDLVLLGIGADGHTASLFPGSAGLHERERLIVAHHVPSLNIPRMTMTYPLVWAARQIVVLACGADKADPIKRVFNSPVSSQQSAFSLETPPAAAVRAARGRITWILDTAAALQLPSR